MPRAVSSELGMSVTGSSPFSDPRRGKTERENCLTQLSLNREMPGCEVSTQAEVNEVKLPVVTRTARPHNEENNDLEVLLRVRCSDFPLQVHGLKPEGNKTSDKSSRDIERFRSDSREITTQERVLCDQNNEESWDESDPEESLEENNLNASPLSSSTVLEGQRVNLREKDENKQRKLQEKGNKLEDLSIDETRRKSLPKLVSLKSRKQDTRWSVFHLPKVDKYDMIHKNIIDVKVCSVFKVNDLKSSLIYSGYKDSWVPHRDKNFMKNSLFFKALMRQPTMLLKQSSILAEESLAAAIQTVEETNARLPPIDTEVIRQEKKLVVRLPPIC